jgi:hypothetical protein
MASTPLYKSLKPNGTSFYAFPSAAEDISASYQNPLYKMYFSKYVLVNFPKQNLISGTISKPLYWDFDNAFSKSGIATPVTNFAEGVVESLRNYVANHEVVLRESRLNSNEYNYKTESLETTSEKIFFKWCRKLNLIDFEPADPQDEYVGNLADFSANSLGQGATDFFNEQLWKERTTKSYYGVNFKQSGLPAPFSNLLEVDFEGPDTELTNFKVGDIVNLSGVEIVSILNEIDDYGYTAETGLNLEVLEVIAPSGPTAGQTVVFDIGFGTNVNDSGNRIGTFKLVYNKLIQYIGEVNGLSNVQEANRAYTEVYAHIPDHTGQTPDILFRTMVDYNYGPNLTYPILPRQYQSEIMGAETFNSPIVSDPQDYPGSYYGQFDTNDFTYETSTGDSQRRSGDYFGVTGDTSVPVYDGSSLDGLNIDFDYRHYAKMNTPKSVTGRNLTTFDEFNSLAVNEEVPQDFEFNAILWYYTVEKETTNADGTTNFSSATNLYGISFLNHPDQNQTEGETSLRFPTYKKLVANDTKQQDGTSYAFNLLLNFNIINDNTVPAYNPEAINSQFNMIRFNEAMQRLASFNDSFVNIIADNFLFKEELQNIKTLLYTQTDINVLNSKIQNLENLLRLYSTMQITDTTSVRSRLIPGSPPQIALETVDTPYSEIRVVNTSSMYNAQGSVPVVLNVPFNKKFLIQIVNNDEVELELPQGQKLTLVMDKDLDLRQSMDLNIVPSQFSSENKKLDVFIRTNFSGITSETLLLGDIDLPVSYNKDLGLQNSAYLWKSSNLDIDFTKPINLLQDNLLEVAFEGDVNILSNTLKVGDSYVMNNLFVGTSSVYDFSGQYKVASVTGIASSYVVFDVSPNNSLVDFSSSVTLPYEIHGTGSTTLSNIPYLSLNKGKKLTLTRISNSTNLEERYYIEVNDIM